MAIFGVFARLPLRRARAPPPLEPVRRCQHLLGLVRPVPGAQPMCSSRLLLRASQVAGSIKQTDKFGIFLFFGRARQIETQLLCIPREAMSLLHFLRESPPPKPPYKSLSHYDR